MLKAELDMVVQRVPLGFMLALYGEPLVQPEALCWVLFFSSRMRDRADELSARSHSALLVVMVDLSHSWKVQKLHLLEELSF